jgi:hypothetical protein
MNDMSGTIIAKSDQINAADLIGNPITMTIREVQIKAAGADDQPVSVYFEGETKAFRPCKGVRRLLVHAWGPDANAYIGRSLTLFCDPSVTWAGKPEGGIRVSHMSNIAGEFVFSMRTSRSATKPYRILPIKAPAKPDPAEKWTTAYIGAVEASATLESLNDFANGKAGKLAELEAKRPDLHTSCIQALDARRAALSGEGRADEDHGDQFATDDDVPAEF